MQPASPWERLDSQLRTGVFAASPCECHIRPRILCSFLFFLLRHPVAGQWFMLDISFVIEELAESFTIRAPPDFELAVTGNASECFLVEHSLPNLENCTIYPGQTSERTGPIMVMYFSNPLEPQNSYTLRQDWYHLRVWVHHPQNCTGGNTTDGRCLGLEGEREWTLAVKMTEPVPLWEIVKGGGLLCNEFFLGKTKQVLICWCNAGSLVQAPMRSL